MALCDAAVLVDLAVMHVIRLLAVVVHLNAEPPRDWVFSVATLQVVAVMAAWAQVAVARGCLRHATLAGRIHTAACRCNELARARLVTATT